MISKQILLVRSRLNMKKNWASKIKKLLFRNGFNYVWQLLLHINVLILPLTLSVNGRQLSIINDNDMD